MAKGSGGVWMLCNLGGARGCWGREWVSQCGLFSQGIHGKAVQGSAGSLQDPQGIPGYSYGIPGDLRGSWSDPRGSQGHPRGIPGGPRGCQGISWASLGGPTGLWGFRGVLFKGLSGSLPQLQNFQNITTCKTNNKKSKPFQTQLVRSRTNFSWVQNPVSQRIPRGSSRDPGEINLSR